MIKKYSVKIKHQIPIKKEDMPHTLSFESTHCKSSRDFRFFGVLIAVLLFGLASWGIWFELSHSHEETFVFKNVRVVAATQIVAGLPIKMAALVDVNEMKNGKHLVRIPKSATDISVKKITPQEIKDLAKNKTTQITAQQKAEVLKNIKQVTKIDFRNNFLGSLLQGVNSFLADDEQAVENAVSAVLPDSNSQLVDVSNPAPAGSETPTPAETPAPTETPIVSEPPATESPVLEPLTETPVETPAPAETSTPAETPTPTPTPVPAEQPPCQGDATDNCIAVQYTLPAPVITSQPTDTGALVTVSAPAGSETPDQPLVDVLASTKIPEIFKVGEESKIKIRWKNNGNQDVTFHAEDTDNDGYLDYVEWTVPHLSDQTFEIIFISKAFQLDENQNIVADIYDQVSAQDQNYATVPQNNYVRITFAKVLDSTKDITVYAKSQDPNSNAQIQVYPVYTDADGNQTEGAQLTTVSDGQNPDFSNISADGKYRILLQNLQAPTDLFDLKITDGSIDIDYIVDPSTVSTSTNTMATANSHQRKTWYDGSRYWVAFYNGTAIVFYYSVNGTSGWTLNSSASITVGSTYGIDFSIAADSSNAFIYFRYTQNVGNYSVATSYPGISFGWGTPGNIDSNNYAYNGVLAKDSNNKVWVLYNASSNGRCIVQGQKINLADGSEKNIEDLVAGDELLGFNDTNLNLTKNKVLKISSGKSTSYFEIKTKSSTTEVTADHLFFVGSGQYKRTDELKIGNVVYNLYNLNKISKEKIISIKKINKKVNIYDITTDNFHNFIVSNFLVHNASWYMYVKQSTNANSSPAGWGGSTSLGTGAATAAQMYGQIVSLGSGNMYAVWNDNGSIKGKKYNGTSWDTNATTIATGSASYTSNMSVVPDYSSGVPDGNFHLVYVDSSGHVDYEEYTGSWPPSPVVLDSNAGNSNVSISINPSTNNIWVYYIRSNTIYYEKGVSPYASGNWTTYPSLYSTNTNTYLIAGANSGNSKIFLEWTNYPGSGSTYNIYFDNSITDVTITAPTVTTSAASSIAATSVTGNGNVTADGGATVTARGFYYATAASSDCSGASGGTQVTAGSGTGAYTGTIPASGSLTANSYYCYRSYATNSAGTGYGAWTSFDTAPDAPTSIHIASNNSTTTLAKSGDTVTVTATVDANTTVTGTIGGQATTTNTVSSTTATLTRLLTGAETEGAGLDFTLVSTNNAGTASAATVTKANISDGSAVKTDFTAPAVSSVAVQTGLTVNVVFNEAMGTGVTTASNYTVSGTGKGTLASNPNSAALVSSNTYVLTWSSGEMFNGGNITITVASAQDSAGNAIGATNSGTHTGGAIGTAPTVSGVTSSLANGTYGVGQVVPIQVNFSENVTVTGTPQITLTTGSPATTAINYTSGSGTGTLTFNYTVATGNHSADLDYASTTALALNSGTINDAAGNPATLTLASPGATNSLGANKNIVIAINSLPTASSATISSPALVGGGIPLTAGTTTTVTATFSVTDADGCSDIDSKVGGPVTSAKLYRTNITTLGYDCTPNAENCYAMSCTQSSCTAGVANYSCTSAVQYYADATDTGAPNAATNWTVTAIPADSAGANTLGNNSYSAEMNSLTALTVTQTSITYGTGSMALNSDTGTGDKTTEIINKGNRIIDAEVKGYGANSGDTTHSMSCVVGTIPIGNEKYTLTSSSTPYASLDYTLSGSFSQITAFNLSPTTDGSDSKKNIYWGIATPSSGAGSCSGTISFTSVNH